MHALGSSSCPLFLHGAAGLAGDLAKQAEGQLCVGVWGINRSLGSICHQVAHLFADALISESKKALPLLTWCLIVFGGT